MSKHTNDIFNNDVIADAKDLYDQWINLGEDECLEQVEAHLESDGYSSKQILFATSQLFEPVHYY